MKKLTSLLMASTLALGALTGCQTMTDTTNVNPHTHQKITTMPITNDALQAHNWQLTEATTADGKRVDALFFNTQKPLTLNFMATDNGNIVSFENTCNNISAPYSLSNGNLKLENIMSTMKACPDAEAAFDAATVATVMGEYTLSKNDNNEPVLVISNDNQVAHFKAVPKSK